MKRFTILLLSLMTLGMYAQAPSITDFTVDYGGRRKGEFQYFKANDYALETKSITGLYGEDKIRGGDVSRATYEIVVNPDQTGINKNTQCLKVYCNNKEGTIRIDFNSFDYSSQGSGSTSGWKPDMNGRRRISMLFKAGPNMGNDFYSKLQLETNYGTEGWQTYVLGAYYGAVSIDDTPHDGWKRLYFDFTPYNEYDNKEHPELGYHKKKIGDFPEVLKFSPKRYDVYVDPDTRDITKRGIEIDGEKTGLVECNAANDYYYIDDIRLEDVPYAEGYWIHDDVNLPKGDLSEGNWISSECALPKEGKNGVIHLSGTWLKGENLVNPEIWEKEIYGGDLVSGRYPWDYEFNEYRDLSWHVNAEKVKLMVFKDDSELRWPDRGGLMGHNSEGVEPEWLIRNYNVLIFAEKSCVRPDEGDNLDAHWHDTNAVIHYKAGDIHYGTATGDIWEAWELELTDKYGFVNPLEFTALNLIKVHRDMKAGFNALIYPFELTPAELKCARVGTVYHHRDKEDEGLLYFVPAPKTEPNVPYLTEYLASSDDATSKVAYDYQEFRNDNHIVYPVQEDYPYSNNASKGTLFGNYQKDFSGVGKWGLVTTETWQGFMLGEGDAKFKPFRGYLDELPAADVSGARMLSIFDADDTDVTGIETPGLPFKAETLKTIYDMQGRVIKGSSIATLSKGIYIINGKKTIIK